MSAVYKNKKGIICIVKCPKCGRENYTPKVHSGQCYWCGYNPNKDDNLTK